MCALTLDWETVLAAVGIISLLVSGVFVWALCRAAALADRDMERMRRENLD